MGRFHQCWRYVIRKSTCNHRLPTFGMQDDWYHWRPLLCGRISDFFASYEPVLAVRHLWRCGRDRLRFVLYNNIQDPLTVVWQVKLVHTCDENANRMDYHARMLIRRRGFPRWRRDQGSLACVYNCSYVKQMQTQKQMGNFPFLA